MIRIMRLMFFLTIALWGCGEARAEESPARPGAYGTYRDRAARDEAVQRLPVDEQRRQLQWAHEHPAEARMWQSGQGLPGVDEQLSPELEKKLRESPSEVTP